MNSAAKKLELGKVSICIVNYKTEILTRLCLRSIRKYTRFPYRIIVVDNDSDDSSLDYLRSLNWITLIERPGEVGKSGSWAHGTALDLGLAEADTEFFMTMHSDTFVHKEGWLTELVGPAVDDPETVCLGGGKLDLKPKWQVLLKKYTDFKKWKKQLKNKNSDDFYIRTICALYRTEILLDEKLRFAMNVDDGVTCGRQLYLDLMEKGYRSRILPAYKMAEYIYHLAHATMVLNPEFKVRKRTEKKCRKYLARLFESDEVQDILNDKSLDE